MASVALNYFVESRGMYEDLERIANLRIGKELDAVARESQAEQTSTMAHMSFLGTVTSGNTVMAVMGIHLRGAERLCHCLADTWVDLIKRRNKRISREDIGFIMQKVETFTTARASSIPAAIKSMPALKGVANAQLLADKAGQEMQRIAGEIRRDLEIDLREKEAFPHEASAGDLRFHLNIQNSNISNLNLGSQIGAIRTALQVMSSGNEEQQQVAQALKELTETIVASNNVQAEQKKEIVQALSTLAREAEGKPEERSTGTVRAITNWLPTVLAGAADAITIWDKFAPLIKAHFRL